MTTNTGLIASRVKKPSFSEKMSTEEVKQRLKEVQEEILKNPYEENLWDKKRRLLAILSHNQEVDRFAFDREF